MTLLPQGAGMLQFTAPSVVHIDNDIILVTLLP